MAGKAAPQNRIQETRLNDRFVLDDFQQPFVPVGVRLDAAAPTMRGFGTTEAKATATSDAPSPEVRA
jgi:glycine/serine hydroxymethyltransferase